MKKKGAKKRVGFTQRVSNISQSQMELTLTTPSATVLSFPTGMAKASTSNKPKRSPDSSKRLLEYAATLPDW